MNNGQILVIDDEVQIRKLLAITLESHDFLVKEAASAREGISMAANHHPDLIILDLGLPDENGHEVLRKLREWYTRSIIILSVQNSEEDIIRALDHGADDYLVKPFRTGELLARIRASLRKNTSPTDQTLFDYDDLQIDFAARTVKRNLGVLKLTATEYTLLSLLARNEGKVLTHQYILQQVWGPLHIDQSQYLRVYIAQLRKKIEADPNRPAHIITESGVGYRFVGKK